jgi:hypothetical protein
MTHLVHIPEQLQLELVWYIFPTMCPGALPSLRRPKDHGVPTSSPHAPPLVLVCFLLNSNFETLVLPSLRPCLPLDHGRTLATQTSCTSPQNSVHIVANHVLYLLAEIRQTQTPGNAASGRTEIAAQTITPPLHLPRNPPLLGLKLPLAPPLRKYKLRHISPHD